MREKGIVHLLPLFVIAIIVIIVLLIKTQNFSTPTLEPTPTATPTSTPTPTPSPKPTTKPTSSGTPKPTQAPVSGPPGAGLSTITVHTEKGDFRATVLSVDLNSARVITDTANDSDCANNCPILPLKDFVARNAGFAGVNGAYYCPADYAECAGKVNSFDFPVYNTRLSKWINGGNLGWGGRAMFYVDGSGAHYLQNASSFSGGLTAGVVNFPGLLSGGNVQIDDNQSGLTDKQKSAGTKVGIGVRGTKNVMVVIAYNVTMQQFAYVFKSLSADGALNLDAGGTTALYYNGAYRAGPGRDLTNAIIFAK